MCGRLPAGSRIAAINEVSPRRREARYSRSRHGPTGGWARRCRAAGGFRLGHQGNRMSRKERPVQIRARLSISADGYVTTPDGWPAQLADPAFVSGESHGIREFLDGKEAALMGRTTFEPALASDRWPWPNLDVFVLGS